LSEEQEERIEIDMDNNGDFKESSEPVEIIREEVVEVVENPNAETSLLSSMKDQNEEEEDQKNEIQTGNRNRYNEDIYEQIKAQSIRLSSLTDMVQSLQSQVKQLQETIRLRKHNKPSSVRKKSTSNKGINTQKKTKRRVSTRSRKK
jgi:DNA polymerase II small subunit/DNA polymerase delta subunit B